MKNPSHVLSKNSVGRVVVILLLLNVIIIYVMQVMGRSLLPFTIVQFEFAGTVEHAKHMIDTWKQSPDTFAKLNFMMGFDYLFMITYSSILLFLCGSLAERISSRALATAGILIAWGQPVAALFDAIENYALWKLILGFWNPLFPAIAKWCAIPKFGIVGIGLIYVIVGMIQVGVNGIKKAK